MRRTGRLWPVRVRLATAVSVSIPTGQGLSFPPSPPSPPSVSDPSLSLCCTLCTTVNPVIYAAEKIM